MGLRFDDPSAGAAAPAPAPDATAAAQPPQKPGVLQGLKQWAQQREARRPLPQRDPDEAKQAGAQWLQDQNRYESSEEQYARETAGAQPIWNAPGQIAGEYTTKATAPYIGQEPAKLLGAGVSGLASPMPGVSTLPRVAYGVASELGHDIASPVTKGLTKAGHPYAAAGVDIAAQLAPALVAEPAWKGITGQGQIAASAERAAQQAEEKGVTERATLTGKAEEETLAEKQAREKALADAQAKAQAEALAERQGKAKQSLEAQAELDKRIAAAQQAGEQRTAAVTEQATAAQQGMPEVEKTARDKANAAYAELHEKTLKAAEPEARHETISNILGKPSDVTMEQGPERIARGEEFRQTVQDPLQRWRADWQQRRNSALAPMRDTIVDDAPLRERVLTEQQKWLPTHKPYSPKVQAFLDQMSAEPVAGPSDEELLKGSGITAAQRRGIEPEQLKQVADQLRAKWIEAHPEEAEARPSVADLVAHQEQAKTMARAAKGADRTALNQVVRGIDDTLASVDAPSLKGLNAEYADHRANFPYEFEDKMRTAARPVDVAGDIFNHPQRALDLAKLSTPQERPQLAGLYRDWVAENGTKVVTKDHQPFLNYLFHGTPLAKPEAWIYEDKAVTAFGEKYENAPAVRAKVDQVLQQGGERIKGDFADETIKAAMKDSDPKLIGPAGYRIRRMIDAAKTPEQKVQAALEGFRQMNPQASGAQAGLQQHMETLRSNPLAQGYDPNVGRMAQLETAPKPPFATKARDELANYQPPPFTTKARDALAAYQPPDPEQAAVKAITGFEPGKGLWDRWKWRAEMWTLMTGGAVATGQRPLRTGVFGLLAGIPIAGREMIAVAYRNSLRDPQEALKFYRAVTNPGVQSNLDYLGEAIIKSQIAQRMGQPSIPGPVTAPQSDSPSRRTPGPMSQDISRKQAVAIATERGRQDPTHIDQVQDLNKQIAMGNTPDIHQDLTTGRLSNTEIRQMVKPEQTASMFQGMNLPDAFEAFSKGSPEEKQIALAPLAQKLNDEGKNLSPLQRRQMMARLRTELGEGEEATA